MNPYEIRLETLKMAKEVLFDRYYDSVGMIRDEWTNECTWAQEHNEKAPPAPNVTPPTEDDILELATKLNGFVSNPK